MGIRSIVDRIQGPDLRRRHLRREWVYGGSSRLVEPHTLRVQ